MPIEKEWSYKWAWFWKYPFLRKLPFAWIVEGTSQIQCLCPSCDYAKGYNKPISLVFDIKAVLHCDRCDLDFYGLKLGEKF